jgi:hypothetical protein
VLASAVIELADYQGSCLVDRVGPAAQARNRLSPEGGYPAWRIQRRWVEPESLGDDGSCPTSGDGLVVGEKLIANGIGFTELGPGGSPEDPVLGAAGADVERIEETRH